MGPVHMKPVLCPHCCAAAVPQMQVRWSGRGSPATCGACGKLSHVLASTSSAIAGADWVLLSLALAAGLVMQSWLAGLSVMLLALAHNLWAWRRVELFPITPESARASAQVTGWVLAAVAFLKLFSS